MGEERVFPRDGTGSRKEWQEPRKTPDGLELRDVHVMSLGRAGAEKVKIAAKDFGPVYSVLYVYFVHKSAQRSQRCHW